MWKAFASARGTTTDYTVLKLPILLSSLALTILPLLLPLYSHGIGTVCTAGAGHEPDR
jgi:hypothetical protein